MSGEMYTVACLYSYNASSYFCVSEKKSGLTQYNRVYEKKRELFIKFIFRNREYKVR